MTATDVRLLDVLIISPGDALDDVDTVVRTLDEWNESRGKDKNVILRPRRWLVYIYPAQEHYPKDPIINRQLIEASDIVIVLFYSSLGGASPQGVANTIDEFKHAGKAVYLLFSTKPLPYDINLAQVHAVRSFRETLAGLYETYASEAELTNRIKDIFEHEAEVFHPSHGQRQPAVLLVNDDEYLRTLLSRLFLSYGMDVSAHSTLAFAAQAASETPFDLIVVDVGFSEGRRVEADFLSMVRKHLPDVPIILYSSLPSDALDPLLKRFENVEVVKSQVGIEQTKEWVERSVDIARKHFEARAARPDQRPEIL